MVSAPSGVGGKMVKVPLFAVMIGKSRFFAPRFARWNVRIGKTILILLRSFLRVFALIRNFAVESAAAHKAL